MSTNQMSRRAFLRTGATTLATAGVGSVPALTGSAIKTIAVGGAATSKILQKLGADGGFPFRGISFLFHNFRNKSSEDIKKLQQQIMGDGELSYYGEDDHRHGKVCVEGEGIITTLMELPQDIPIKDLFSDDMISIISENSKFDGEQMDAVLELLNPICNDQTTASDLTQSYLEYFKKVARHAIKAPEDFFYKQGSGKYACITRGPEFKKVHSILEKFSDGNEEIQKLNEELMKSIKSTNQKHFLLEQAKRKKLGSDIEANKKAREDAEAKEKQVCIDEPDSRDRIIVRLLSIGEGNTYKVGYFDQPEITRPDQFPTWVDWYHFALEKSPNTAKPSDIKISALGMLVTFNDKALASFISNQEKDTSFMVTVELPNRRSGVDLNHPRKLNR